jgi:hypothetical protein
MTTAFDNVRQLARGLDGRFVKRTDDVFGPISAGLVAREVPQPTGLRATLTKHFPTWDLTDNPPIFDETLEALS